MDQPPHLQIFNNIWKNTRKESTFTCFGLLPTELRLQIWQCSLQRERMINVHFLRSPEAVRDHGPWKVRGKDISYNVIVDGHQALSKLLLVNQEARQVALGFYRVHFPCRLRDEHAHKEEEGTFYFNPEYDFLQIPSSFSTRQDPVDFFYHLKYTYDPRQVGVLNLAIWSTSSPRIHPISHLTSADFTAYYRESLLETIAQLREVFFVQNVIKGRQILGTRSGMPSNDFLLNRSMPVATATTVFDRLAQDPRPVAGDLKHVYVRRSPVEWFGFWQLVLDHWGISPTHIKYHYILSFRPEPFAHFPQQSTIYDTKKASEWLQKEDYEWTGKWRVDEYDPSNDDGSNIMAMRTTSDGRAYNYPVGALHERYRHEDLENAVKPAFGFWLFPVCPDESGRMPSSFGDPHPSGKDDLLDLSGFWPGIGLMDLP